ncbi:hypothetical protein [Streptomyces sp. H51]|uniref:hypothetical protein n=1 Tax=Streptomyces sp. H51 TaxID=3111770 RepID=UPI002D76C2DF|nr:hypothetical protein [Streptomyces sp. H51]
MNTERPDNDDVVGPSGDDESRTSDAGHAPGAEGSAAGTPAEDSAPGTSTPAQDSDPGDEARAGDSASRPSAAGKAEAGTPSAAGKAGAVSAVGEGEAGVPDATPGPGERQAHDAGARALRRRSPAVVASVVAAVLLVGAGGAYLAADATGGSGGSGPGAPGGDGTPPPLALDGRSEGGTNGIAPGEPDPYGTTYRVDGTLPDGPDSAPVYRAAGQVTEEEVARLAEALGLDGTPVARGRSWWVGPAKDGSGPSLVVDRQAPGNWTFHRYAAGTDACQGTLVCTKDPANPVGRTVSEAAAKKAVAPVLKAAGQDAAKVDASRVTGTQRVVNADPVVGGLPTYGWTTGLAVNAQGELVGGNGRLKAPVKGDTYPVLGARETLDAMNAAPPAGRRTGIGGCASPVPLKDRLEEPCGQSSPGGTATPAQPAATVEGAVFGLAAHTVDGRPALVPSWLFEVRAPGARDTVTVTRTAVDPEYLASGAPSGAPSATAAPRGVKVDGYSADDRELTVTFTGGVCADYEATASESPDRVTVTVTETPWPDKVCIKIAKEYRKVLHLDEPLGDRTVVGSDGKPIPRTRPGARLPQPSGAR